MKTDWLRLALLGTAALAIIMLVGSFLVKEEPLRESVTGSSPVEEETVRQREPYAFGKESKPLYRLGIWQGRVAVFHGTENELLQVTEMPAASLPEPDRALLKQGIPVYSQEELAHLLEDYGS